MIAFALDTWIGVTVVMLLVLAVRRPVARRFGAGWAYALWLLPLARMLLAPPLNLFEGAAGAVQPYTMILLPAAETVAAGEAAGAAAAFDWLSLLIALWIGGAAVFALWQQSTYSAFVMSLGPGRRGRPPEHGGVAVVECDAVEGPVAIGFLKRRIVVPTDFCSRWNPAERRLALDHELTHHRRGDLWWNLAALAVLALNWFNPVAWFAFRAFRIDQELSCDAAVTARMPPAARADYAAALVKAATVPGQIATCPLNHVEQLKERLRMMREHRVSPARAAGGVCALALLAGLGFSIAAPGLAREAPPAPQLVLRAGEAGALLAAHEAETLRAHCAAAAFEDGALFRRTGTAEGLILCSDGSVVDAPEVRAIVARAAGRSAAAVANAASAPQAPAAPAPEAAPAVPEPVASPAAPPPVRVAHERLDPEQVAEIRREMAEARSEVEREMGRIRTSIAKAAMVKLHHGRHVDAERIAARIERELEAQLPQIERQVERALSEASVQIALAQHVPPAPPRPPRNGRAAPPPPPPVPALP